jgi:hypothetical protein
MKKRVRKIANFLAFNLLFFALYLNFIHKDKQAVINVDRGVQPATAAFSGTVPVENPEKYLGERANLSTSQTTTEEKSSIANRSIN